MKQEKSLSALATRECSAENNVSYFDRIEKLKRSVLEVHNVHVSL